MDPTDQHRTYAPKSLRFAVVTASDSRTETEDQSGTAIVDLASDAGHQLVTRRIVKDDSASIRRAVVEAIEERQADLVILNGGTGFSPRDVSPDAVLPVFDRVVEGFGEAFRALSYRQIGAAAMLSRATAGIVARSVVFVIPGSPKAVELAMSALILPEAPHLIGQLRRQDRQS
jgi:molybdenum cofactor biosynthesis protein B